MAGDDLHRGLLSTSAHVLHWLCNIGVGHARPSSTGDHVQSKALPPPELGSIIAARGDELDDGAGNWNDWSPAEVIKYGDLSQAAYVAFRARDGGPSSHHGTCRYGLRRLLPALGLAGHGYVATTFLYATVDVVPGVARDDHRHWIGYVAVADDAERDRAGGCRDIVVVWRGTAAPDEMFKDFEARLVPFHGGCGEEESEPGTAQRIRASAVRVEDGFHSLYASGCDACREHGNSKLSARSQVLRELRRLVTHFSTKHPGEKICVTATGHSLGGALAVLTAWDSAEGLSTGSGVVGRVPVRAVTFGAPRVGNAAFRDELLASRGVRVLRVFVKQDVVPLMPLASLGYVHAGDELELDAETSPYPQTLHGPWHFHRLKLYLRLLDGHKSAAGAFLWDKDYSVMLGPETDTDNRPLEVSELDQMVSSRKEIIFPNANCTAILPSHDLGCQPQNLAAEIVALTEQPLQLCC